MQEALFLGKNVISLSEIESTNDYAKQLLAESKQIEGTLITADFQSKGKGQMGNEWKSEAGKNIIASYILHPHFLSADKQFYLNMAVALGVKEFCEVATSLFAQIKWPNDILVEEKKVAGILIASKK